MAQVQPSYLAHWLDHYFGVSAASAWKNRSNDLLLESNQGMTQSCCTLRYLEKRHISTDGYLGTNALEPHFAVRERRHLRVSKIGSTLEGRFPEGLNHPELATDSDISGSKSNIIYRILEELWVAAIGMSSESYERAE
jgi:hypothetical protein